MEVFGFGWRDAAGVVVVQAPNSSQEMTPIMPLNPVRPVRASRSLARSMCSVSPSLTATSSMACSRIVAASWEWGR